MEPFSMIFTKEEIERHLIQPLKKKGEVRSIGFDEACDDAIVIRPASKCDFIGLNFELEHFKDCHISFYGYQTSLYITNKLEITFYDETIRSNITSSDTYGNVVYNGPLQGMPREVILEKIANIISRFATATSFTFEEERNEEPYDGYPKCKYLIRILDGKCEPPILVAHSNIRFLIKPDELVMRERAEKYDATTPQPPLSMIFTKEEIERHLIEPLKKKGEVRSIGFDEACDDAIFIRPASKCDFIGLNFELEHFKDCHISFYGYQTSLYITNKLEITFYDEAIRSNITSSDTYGNVVYNGPLQGMPREVILEKIANIISIFATATSFTFEEEENEDPYNGYPKCNYIIRVTDETQTLPQRCTYSNITFAVESQRTKEKA